MFKYYRSLSGINIDVYVECSQDGNEVVKFSVSDSSSSVEIRLSTLEVEREFLSEEFPVSESFLKEYCVKKRDDILAFSKRYSLDLGLQEKIDIYSTIANALMLIREEKKFIDKDSKFYMGIQNAAKSIIFPLSAWCIENTGI